MIGFNGAAVFQPRKDCQSLDATLCPGCFNGAAVFQPRKASVSLSSSLTLFLLQWGRGLSTAEGTPLHSSWCGIDQLQWGRGLSTAEGRSSSGYRGGPGRFNGAAVFQPRKDPLKRSTHTPALPLQWGRGLSTAEGHCNLVRSPVLSIASMGPRSFNRGRGQGL